MRKNAIEISGLAKTYAATRRSPPKAALGGIDLEIPKGSVFGLLGPNGAGKSTLINIMAGLVMKSAGKVTIWGFDQDVNPRQSRAAIGVVPQELNLDAFLTPRETLECQAGLYGVAQKDRRTDEILAAVGLADKAHSYARSLSGGMRRRLLMGKAMVHSPPVLVLDEPTAGVDIELRRMLWDYIRDLNLDHGVTIILTTHYLEEAEAMCDEIAIIDRGRIVAQDKTRDLIATIDAKTLVVTPSDPVAGVGSLPPDVALERRENGSLALTYSRSRMTAGEILTALGQAGVIVRDVTSEEPDLEDVFVSLTGSHGAG
ncbi:MAG: ABC transporter ATP-binding protein [Paracoccaceae bacterium]